MTLKRLLALLLAVLMVFSLLSVLTACDSEDDDRSSSHRDDDDDEDEDDEEDEDEDEDDEGNGCVEIDPDDLEWESTDDGIKLTNYTGDDIHVKIPDTIEGKKVVSLGKAFAGNVMVETIVLGEYVEVLNGSWFKGCDALVRLVGPNVTELTGDELDCDALEELVLPKLESLVVGDIERCESLRYLEIPNVEVIRAYNRNNYHMYLWPETLEEVVIPEGMMARMDAFCDWDGEDLPYYMICSFARESYLDDDGEVDYDDPRYRDAYVTMDEDINLFYCNFFQHDTIIVNGERYELD